MKKIYAVANQKGGVGKTTTAMNLAAGLARAGRRCLLVDLDPQGNATSGLGSERRESSGSDGALLQPDVPDIWIEKSRVENLSLVPSTRRLNTVENALRHEVNRYQRLKRAVGRVADKFDFIIIDCPPSSGLLPMNALNAAHEVIVPVQCEYYAMEGLAQMLDTIQQAQAEHGATVTIGGFLLTMFDQSIPLGAEIVKEVVSHFPSSTYDTRIPRDPILSEAPSHGMAVLEYDVRSRGANAYIQFTREIIHANE